MVLFPPPSEDQWEAWEKEFRREGERGTVWRERGRVSEATEVEKGGAREHDSRGRLPRSRESDVERLMPPELSDEVSAEKMEGGSGRFGRMEG